jgi:hypothetical protein
LSERSREREETVFCSEIVNSLSLYLLALLHMFSASQKFSADCCNNGTGSHRNRHVEGGPEEGYRLCSEVMNMEEHRK